MRAVDLLIGLIIGLIVGAGISYLLLLPATTILNPPSGTSTVVGAANTTTSTVTSTLISTTTLASSAAGNASLPSIPAPIPVTVDPKTSALLVLDYVFCYRSPGCNATLPTVANLIDKARSAGIPIIYTRQPIKELANKTGEPVILNDVGADKFYNTSLANILQSKGVKTLIIAGIAPNGALMYTAQEAIIRRYTVIIPKDTIIGTDFVQTYVQYQLLNFAGRNPTNKPQTGNITISTTPEIQFKTTG